MSTVRELAKLRDHVDLVAGFAFASKDYSESDGDVRLLRGDNVAQGSLRWQNAKRWPASDASAYAAYELAEGDVVLAMDRPWIEAGLKFARVDADDLPALLVQRVARLRARETMDQDFLYYLLATRAFTRHIVGVQTGTAVPHISARQILDFDFVLPLIEQQREATTVLGALDEKVRLNKRLINHLDALSLATFRHLTRAAETVALATVAEVLMGASPPGDTYNTEAVGLPFYQGTRDFGLRYPSVRIYCSAPTRTASSGDVLFSVRAPVGVINVAMEDCCIGRGVAGIRSVQAAPETLLQALRHSARAWQQYDAQGTVFGSINAKQLRNAGIVWPASDHLAHVEAAVAPMTDRLRLAHEQNLRLAGLRDALLHRLVVGVQPQSQLVQEDTA